MLPGNLHGLLNLTGAEGCNQRYVVVVGLVQLLDEVRDEVVVASDTMGARTPITEVCRIF